MSKEIFDGVSVYLSVLCDFRASNNFVQGNYAMDFIVIPRFWENRCFELHRADYLLTKPEKVKQNAFMGSLRRCNLSHRVLQIP